MVRQNRKEPTLSAMLSDGEVAAGIRHAHTYSTDVFNQGYWLIGLHSFPTVHTMCKKLFTDSAPTNGGLGALVSVFFGRRSRLQKLITFFNAGDDERVTGRHGKYHR